MSPFAVMDELRTFLEVQVKETIDMASNTPVDGSEAWAEYMRLHHAVAKTSEERKEIISLKSDVKKGALPAEVRMILENHKSVALHQLQEFRQQFGQEEWWSRVEVPANKMIEEFIDEGVKKYLGKITTKVSAHSIFSNSSASTPKYYNVVYEAGARSETCPTCQAARPEGTALTTCAFCGSPIFNA